MGRVNGLSSDGTTPLATTGYADPYAAPSSFTNETPLAATISAVAQQVNGGDTQGIIVTGIGGYTCAKGMGSV
jgi:hypothetical protein